MGTDLRENTGTINHPEFLHGYPRVVGFTVQPIHEYDDRLALYLGPESQYYLFRLEHDEQYRLVCRSKPYELLSPEGVNRLVLHLTTIDSRLGVDVGEETIAANEKWLDDSRKGFNEIIDEEVAPQLAYWAGRAYLPGVDIRARLR